MTVARRTRLALGAVALASLGLVTTVNRFALTLVPGAPWLPDTCAASLIACVAIYFAIRPAHPFARPSRDTRWPRIARVAGVSLVVWLAGSVVASMASGHWVRYRLANSPEQLVGFLLLGPLQEEILFRGAIYELAERNRLGVGPWPPILVATTSFALHHLQLHGFALSRAALGQVGFAVPMGIAFGLLRAESRSLWPGLALHVLTNVPGAFG